MPKFNGIEGEFNTEHLNEFIKILQRNATEENLSHKGKFPFKTIIIFNYVFHNKIFINFSLHIIKKLKFFHPICSLFKMR